MDSRTRLGGTGGQSDSPLRACGQSDSPQRAGGQSDSPRRDRRTVGLTSEGMWTVGLTSEGRRTVGLTSEGMWTVGLTSEGRRTVGLASVGQTDNRTHLGGTGGQSDSPPRACGQSDSPQRAGEQSDSPRWDRRTVGLTSEGRCSSVVSRSSWPPYDATVSCMRRTSASSSCTICASRSAMWRDSTAHRWPRAAAANPISPHSSHSRSSASCTRTRTRSRVWSGVSLPTATAAGAGAPLRQGHTARQSGCLGRMQREVAYLGFFFSIFFFN